MSDLYHAERNINIIWIIIPTRGNKFYQNLTLPFYNLFLKLVVHIPTKSFSGK